MVVSPEIVDVGCPRREGFGFGDRTPLNFVVSSDTGLSMVSVVSHHVATLEIEEINLSTKV